MEKQWKTGEFLVNQGANIAHRQILRIDKGHKPYSTCSSKWGREKLHVENRK